MSGELNQPSAQIRAARFAQTIASEPLGVREASDRIRSQLRDVLGCVWFEAGDRVAIAVGSRDVAGLPVVLRVIVDELRGSGLDPFMFAAMGSHGNSEWQSQAAILESTGITAFQIGAPIRYGPSRAIGRSRAGRTAYLSAPAAEAEFVLIANRIATHTDFVGSHESGLAKMLAIGCGGMEAAVEAHKYGPTRLEEAIIDVATFHLRNRRLLAGVGLVEDGFRRVNHLRVCDRARLLATDRQMLQLAKALKPRLPVEELDALVIDEIGKDISGTGMDPKVFGRLPGRTQLGSPQVRYVIAGDLTEKTRGNATGIGLADLTTDSLVAKIDFDVTYANAIAGGIPSSAAIPPVAKTVRAAVETVLRMTRTNAVRLIQIKNTAALAQFVACEALFDELGREDIRRVSDVMPLFSAELREWRTPEDGRAH